MKIIAAFLLLLSAAASLVYATPDKQISTGYNDFSGGLNNFTASIYLQPNESPNLQNVVIDEPLGQLHQRNGYLTCGHTPSGNTVTNLYNFNQENGARYLIVTDNISIWQTDDCQYFTTITTGLDASYLPRFATIQNKLWIVNGKSSPMTWDGTILSVLDGGSGRPNAPITKYINFWKNRVWLGNSAANPSGLYFNQLVDNLGHLLDPSTAPAAWTNASNLIYFNRDDGSPIYGVKIYKDNLYVFKETGILRLLFTDEFTIGGIIVSKTVSTTGCKFNESITEMDDGLIRFVGKDGVYSFDGSNVKRLSTKWTPTFYTILQPGQGEAFNSWDSPSDFSAGVITNLANGTVQGYSSKLSLPVIDFANYSLYLSSQQTVGFTETFPTTKFTTNWSITGVKNFPPTDPTFYYGTKIINVSNVDFGSAITAAADNSTSTVMATMDTCYVNPTGGVGGFILEIQDINGNDVYSTQHYSEVHNGFQTGVRESIDISNLTGPIRLKFSDFRDNRNFLQSSYFPAEIVPGRAIVYGYGIGNDWTLCNGSGSQILKTRIALPSLSTETPKSFFPLSGTFESQDVLASQLTQWKIFDTVDSNPTQTLAYQIKVADTQAHLLSTSYSSIIPGVVVSPTTNAWVKIKASIASNNTYQSPSIDKLTINWVTGPLTKSNIVSANYQSRYWLSAATDINNLYNNLTMVESKSPLFTYSKFDLPITAYTLFNNNLYAGISNTDKIVQLDN